MALESLPKEAGTKSEIQKTKYETNSNDQNFKALNNHILLACSESNMWMIRIF
jgi:hypothetical protein